jgi:hypothetical protein
MTNTYDVTSMAPHSFRFERRSIQMYPYYLPTYHRQYDQRFFGFGFLPFVAGGLAGLAISPFLFNRPCCPPFYYPPYGPYQSYPPYPTPYGYGGNLPYPSPYGFGGGGPENINIFTNQN